MTGYTTKEVARLLGLSPAQIRSYTRAAFLSPARAAGGRGELRFSFQDLVLLRAAKGLMAARIQIGRARLNSSHLVISYAVFCLKKKKKQRAGARYSYTS